MGADLLTTWGVVLEPDGTGDRDLLEPASRWFAEGRAAYFQRCPGLAGFLRAAQAELRLTAERIGHMDPASCAGGLKVGVSVVEVRSSSFDVAVRIRPVGDDAARPTNGRCTIVIQRRATGERLPIPREVRDEFIAIQLAARELC